MKSTIKTALAVFVILTLSGCGGEESPYDNAIQLAIGLAVVASLLTAIIIRFLRHRNSGFGSNKGGGSTTIMVALVVLALAGCGGNGTGLSGGGGGGGGGERIAASNLGPADTEIGAGQGFYRGAACQGFLGNGEPLAKVSFQLYKLGLPTGSYVVEVWADNNGSPDKNVVLAMSVPFTTTGMTSVVAWYDWLPTNQFTPRLGVHYWLALRLFNGTFDPGGCLVVKATSNPDSYAGGRFVSIDGNGNCQELGYDALFKIWTRP